MEIGIVWRLLWQKRQTCYQNPQKLLLCLQMFLCHRQLHETEENQSHKLSNNKKSDETCTQLMHQMIRLTRDAVNLLDEEEGKKISK